MNKLMNKSVEYSFDVGLALMATLLQVNVPTFDWYSVVLKLAVFSGSISYVFKVMQDENLSTKDSIFTAFTGYTFGVFFAPVVSKYFHFEQEQVYCAFAHYFAGGMGMWLMNIGWSIMKGANAEAWPIVKGWIFKLGSRVISWIPAKKQKDDTSDNP